MSKKEDGGRTYHVTAKYPDGRTSRYTATGSIGAIQNAEYDKGAVVLSVIAARD